MKAKPLLKAITATLSITVLLVIAAFILYVCASRFPNAVGIALVLVMVYSVISLIFSMFYDKYSD